MSGASAVLGTLQSFIGDIPKAVLLIYNRKSAKGNAAAFSAAGSEFGINTSYADTGLVSFESTTMSSRVGDSKLAENFIQLKVQYNPESISFSATGESDRGNVGKNVNTIGSEQIAQVQRYSTRTTMSFDLIFDEMNVMDAFMLSNLDFSAGNALALGKDIATNLKGGYSVMNQVQGLLSLLLVEKTREVAFYWANMSFHGLLNEASARYTMFNKKGNPIRAVVSLTIRQDAEGKNAADDKLWEDAFERLFQKSDALSTANKVLNNNLFGMKIY